MKELSNNEIIFNVYNSNFDVIALNNLIKSFKDETKKFEVLNLILDEFNDSILNDIYSKYNEYGDFYIGYKQKQNLLSRYNEVLNLNEFDELTYDEFERKCDLYDFHFALERLLEKYSPKTNLKEPQTTSVELLEQVKHNLSIEQANETKVLLSKIESLENEIIELKKIKVKPFEKIVWRKTLVSLVEFFLELNNQSFTYDEVELGDFISNTFLDKKGNEITNKTINQTKHIILNDNRTKDIDENITKTIKTLKENSKDIDS